MIHETSYKQFSVTKYDKVISHFLYFHYLYGAPFKSLPNLLANKNKYAHKISRPPQNLGKYENFSKLSDPQKLLNLKQGQRKPPRKPTLPHLSPVT